MARRHFASDNRPGEDFSRRAARDRYSSQRRRRGSRSRALVLLLSLVVVLALVVVGFVTYALSIQAGLRAGLSSDINTSLSESSTAEPFYLLVVGVEEGQEDRGEDPAAKYADAIVLTRVDAPNKKLTLVSVMRDTMVDLGASGKQKLSATYALGGATYTARIVSQFAGVPVAHYLELDVARLNVVVDLLGGISVNVPVSVNDPASGASLQAGLQTLNGDQVQQLFRARSGYANDASAEDCRAAAQRQIVAGLLSKVLHQNPLAIIQTIGKVNPYVSCSIDLLSMENLASNMRGFNAQSNLFMGQNPYDLEEIDGTTWMVTNRTSWREMMLRVGQGLSPYEPGQEPQLSDADDEKKRQLESTTVPAAAAEQEAAKAQIPSVPLLYEGTVRVLNASGTPGLAAAASDVLKNAGFKPTAGNASEESDSSVIIYATAVDEGKALGVAAALGTGIEVRANDGSYSMSTDVLVILGKDQVR